MVNVGLVSVYSWENAWEIGNKIKMKTMLKTNLLIKFNLNKPLIKHGS